MSKQKLRNCSVTFPSLLACSEVKTQIQTQKLIPLLLGLCSYAPNTVVCSLQSIMDKGEEQRYEWLLLHGDSGH